VLRNCSLVCRAWVPRSHARLYEIISLRTPQAALDLCTKAVEDQSIFDDTGYYDMRLCPCWDEFAAKAERYPHLIQHVRVLCIRMSSLKSQGSLDAWVSSLPLKLASLELPNLTWLQFFHGHLRPPTMFFLMLRQLSQITRLTLDKVVFQSVGDLRRMLCSLHNLKELDISALVWTNFNSELTPDEFDRLGEPIRITAPIRSRLRTLSMEYRELEDTPKVMDPRTFVFHIWLITSGIISELQSLTLRDGLLGPRFRLYSFMVRACGSTLHSLQLSIEDQESATEGQLGSLIADFSLSKLIYLQLRRY
jgi:hypothetical protein